jgi:predicted transcriptional regulator
MNELKTIKEALELLGCTSNAIDFYLTSFKLGKASIGRVATTVRMDRSSAYLACQQLIDLGLIEQDLTVGRKLIWAEPPQTVMAKMRTKIRQFRGQHEAIEQSLPKLLAEYKQIDSKPVLQFFSGQDGLNEISNDVLQSDVKEILLLSNQAEEHKVFSDHDHKDFIQRRFAKGISIRVLATDTPEAYRLQKSDKQNLRQTCIIAGDPPFTSETYIYGDKVAMLSFDGIMFGFIVTSKPFAQSQRFMFEQLWSLHKDKK